MAATLPAGFRELRERDRYLCVAERIERAARELRLLEDGGLEAVLRGDGARGRGATFVVALPGLDLRLHLRPVRHGGLLGGLRGEGLLGLGRPLAELRVNAELAARSAPVARPLLVAARRGPGPLWFAAVGTLHEEDACDGVALLSAAPRRLDVLRAAAAVGIGLRRFHDAGGRHADLQLKNLLLREGPNGVEVRVIDLDRGQAGRPPGPRRRMREIMRLYRSLVKRGVAETVGARGCARFFSAYVQDDRALRRALLARLPSEQRRIAFHAIGYDRPRR